jgi:hypothetical protein
VIAKHISLLTLLLLSSCKFSTSSGTGGSSSSGPVPTATDLNNYIDRLTTPVNKTCGDLSTDIHKSNKFPIIYHAGKNPWKDDYSKAISDQFDKDYMRPLKVQKINEGDLSLLGCTGYNYATDAEKKQFWILFLSAVSKPESNFNSDEEYTEVNQRERTVSTGLLQIDAKASNDWCKILSKEENKNTYSQTDMHNPKTNLQCGLLMMQHQVMGVPLGKPMKKSQPNLEGRIFTGNKFWYWSTLSDRNPDGKKEVIDWFRAHAQRQFKFCNRTNPIDNYTPGLSTRYQEMNCNEVQDINEKNNCKKYLVNSQIESQQIDPRVGENPVDSSCKIIDNTQRAITKDHSFKNTTIRDLDAKGIEK